MLPDAGRLQEEEAERANRKGYIKHRPAKPLFTEEQAMVTLSRLQPVGYQRPMPVAGPRGGVHPHRPPARRRIRADAPRRRDTGGTVIFGGDLGRYNRPILRTRRPASAADVLLVESTYGDREHPTGDEQRRLAALINETAARSGKLIIPAFAIGRVEEVLYAIKKLEDGGRSGRCRSTWTARWRSRP